ncbi:Alpha/Beta hydrolase protein [Leucosporidium creatinivorum]|uniref:Alpha/Beta hydrolase protein n=1 Tax=Leucosporidium creatinivorum TaxID=106004 RepID=A0A1Y2DPH0_9BASI|nr:Alpha/Beta hydrolase protein [Leucosporidium creatinivorum]
MSTSQDKTVSLSFNLHERDSSFPSSLQSYTIAYSVYTPVEAPPSSSLPVLVFCHPFNNSRHYWKPQIEDPLLSSFTKIAIDAPGFAHSRTQPAGSPWSFDLAAAGVLAILDQEIGEKELPRAVIIGDSMGGAHTGLRAALRDEERRKDVKKARIAGVVACGTAAEEESADFVADYTKDAEAFADKCASCTSPEEVSAQIDAFAASMAAAGYTDSTEEPFASAREHGIKVIADSLKLCLANEDGILEGKKAGESMKLNYGILNHRKGLIPELAVRPSPLGDIQVLVVHGTDDAAYPFERKYHERTATAVGENNAETYIVEDGPHFVTASHFEELDKKIVEWIARKVQK